MMVSATQKAVRVLCADDHAVLLEGLVARISREPDMEVVGTCGRLDQLIDRVTESVAQIALVDIDMPGGDVFETIGDLRLRCPMTRVVILSAFVRDHYIVAAIEAGASGYLSKLDDPKVIIDGIRAAMSGELCLSREVSSRFDVNLARLKGSPQTRLGLLTPREQQILRMIGKGCTRREIASAIHRSPKTVDAHRAAIMEKLGIHDRVELARYAIREGLVEA